MTFVDADELTISTNVRVLSVSRLQRWIELRGRCHWLRISSRIARHGQGFERDRSAVAYVRLIFVLVSDLHSLQDCRVHRARIVVNCKVSKDEDGRDNDNSGPYFCNGLR